MWNISLGKPYDAADVGFSLSNADGRTHDPPSGPLTPIAFRPDSATNITDAAFNADSSLKATVDGDNVVTVWSAGESSWTRVRAFTPHGSVLDVAFSPDGSLIATASRDGRAKLWDANSCRKLLTLFGHSQPVRAIAFNPNGSRLATAGEDGTVKVWDITPGASGELMDANRLETLELDALLQLAQRRLSPRRKLTADERRAYLGEESDNR